MSLSKDITFLLIACLAGIAMAGQGSMNSAVSKALGLSEATFIVHLTATLTVLVILILGFGDGNWSNYSKVPWFYYIGGILGVIITYGVVMSISKLGAGNATTAIIVGQVLTACLIDHFGLFSVDKVCFTIWRALGIVFLALGAKLLLK